MNKSQKLAIQQLRAKINVQELLKQHDMAWNAKEAQEIKEGENAKGMDARIAGHV